MPKISQLPPVEAITTGSIIPVVENGITQKLSVGKLFEFLSGALDETFATETELMITASGGNVNTSSLVTTSSFNSYSSSVNSTTQSLNNSTQSLNTFSASVNATGSIINTFSSSVNTTTASLNSYTSSNDGKWNTLGGQTGSFVTTGSNRFNGNQIITGSVDLTGFPLTASFIRLNGGNGASNEDNFHQIRFDYRYDSGSRALGAGGFSHFLTSRHFPGANSNNNALDVYLNNSVGQYSSTAWNSGSTLGVTITATGIGVLKTNPNTALDVSGNLLVTGSIISTTSPIISSSIQINNFGFATTTSVEVNALSLSNRLDLPVYLSSSTFNTFTSSVNSTTQSLNSFTASVIATGSNINSFTASVNGKTGSYATTGSNIFIGTQTISGSLNVSGSLIVTGSARGNVVPITIVSSTASLDMTSGSYFTLTLANTTNTHIRATSITPGVNATLLVTTGTNSSASLSPLLLQPSGSSYTASLGSGKKDVLSLVAFDSTNMYVVSTKAMQ